MKITTIFKIVLVVFVITASFFAGKELQKRNSMKEFADYNRRLAESEALRIEANTLRIEGLNKLQNKLDQKNYEIEVAKMEYAELLENFELSHQDPNIPDTPWDEYVDYIPDVTEPEIIEIIKEVRQEFTDETIYPYRDEANAYNFDLKVTYDSKQSLFFFEPYALNLTPPEPVRQRKSELTLHWFGNSSGMVAFQHDIFDFLPIGFSGGSIDSKFVVGVSVGYRF